MRIVVTGALGYIGSRLVRDVAAELPGSTIALVDTLTAPPDTALVAQSRCEVCEADILSADLERMFQHADAVVHLAALTHAETTVRLHEMERVNVHGTERVAMACARAGVPLLFPSTTSVYGASGRLAEDCAADAIAPQTAYADTKLRGERLLGAIAGRHGLRFTIVRMATVFGPSPRMRFHTAVNRFCRQAATDGSIEVWRTAWNQVRPYLHIGDATAAMIFTLRHRIFEGQIYNIASVNIAVEHVIEAVRHTVPALTVQAVDSPLMNTLSYGVDTERFTRLGFTYGGTLEQGIADVIAAVTIDAGYAPPVAVPLSR